MAFITVKHGDSQEDVFNPTCRIFNLLKCIQRRCKCNDEVELSDENGNIKHLRDCPGKYANELLSDRETLVLLRVEKKENGEVYIPMLKDEYISDEFRSRISTKGLGLSDSRPNSRRIRSTTRRHNKKDEKSKRHDPSPKATPASARLDPKRSRSRQGR